MFKVNTILKATSGSLISGISDIFIKGISIDSRRIKPGEAFIAIKGENFDGHDFIQEAIEKGANCVIHRIGHTLPALPLRQAGGRQGPKTIAFIGVKDTIKALGDIARFQRERFNIPVIAVTGSNGKTTTKEMISWVLAKGHKVLKNEGTKNNHIGVPLTLLKLNTGHDIAVLEIGTNHFGEIGYLADICKPNIGVITNIGPSHLEYLCNLKGVFKEKFTLMKKLKEPRIALLNADDMLLKKEILKKNKKAFILGFGMRKKSDFFAAKIKCSNAKVGFFVNERFKFTLETLGYYNVYNALPAIAIGRLLGMDFGEIAARLANFDFPAGRLKLITLNKIRFLDDTYNSNPASLKQAINTLKHFAVTGRKVLVMGDMLELGCLKEKFHYQAGIQAAESCNIFLCVGRLSKLAAKAAKAKGPDKMQVISCQGFKQARDILFNEIRPREEDIVLVKGSRLMRLEELFKK